MVGPWPLAPHHDHLQYIHHIHLVQRGQNWDATGVKTNKDNTKLHTKNPNKGKIII